MYSINSRVRYTELNHHMGCMDPYSIINYFQDCSTFQSEDIGRGLEYLQSHHRIWLLHCWHLKIEAPARLGDSILISTWPYDFKGFYGYRNFLMQDKQGKLLASADSLWVYMDTESGKPMRIPEDHGGYILEPPHPMEPAKRKLELPEGLEPGNTFRVIKSNIDSYNHVNNGQYIKMAQEFLPEDFLVKSVRVEYRSQAVLGDTVLPLAACTPDCCTVVLADLSHKPYAIIEFHGMNII